MNLYEKQQQHNINIDERILTIEEIEQVSRKEERPYQRKFAFKALNFAMTLSIIALFVAGFFAYMKYPWLAVTAITVPISVAVANMLGFQTSGQSETRKKEKEEKSSEIEEE